MRSPRRELTVPVTVEFEDLDAFGIVHHPRLVAYLERARLRLLDALGLELEGARLAPVVYDLRVRFRKPARLRDRLEVSVFVEDHDAYRLTLGYAVRRQGATLARASTLIAFADLEGGGLVPAPEAYLAALERFLSGGAAEGGR